MTQDTLVISSIAQSHLNVWRKCPRKFQHSFVDGLSLPASIEQQDRLELGERFHLIVQQRELGLDVVDMANSDPNLQRWLAAFEITPPVMLAGDRFSEHRRTCELQIAIGQGAKGLEASGKGQEAEINERPTTFTYLLTTIYDLLILGTSSAQILDWKTHHRPLPQTTLQADWQTRLYLYVLAKTTNYAPEQLSMTYWFANTATAVSIHYDARQHERDRQDLEKLLGEITQAQLGQRFTQLPLHSPECTKCDFAHRCQRAAEDRESAIPATMAIAAYPEVTL